MRSVEQRRDDKRETRQIETRERGQGPDAGPSYQRSQEADATVYTFIDWVIEASAGEISSKT